MNLLAQEAKLLVDAKSLEFEGVRRCLRTAEAAERMELSASLSDFMKAGQWKMLIVKLAKRFEDYEMQQKKGVADAAAAVGAAKRQRPPAVDLTSVSENICKTCHFYTNSSENAPDPFFRTTKAG
jgi:hypothetical protein